MTLMKIFNILSKEGIKFQNPIKIYGGVDRIRDRKTHHAEPLAIGNPVENTQFTSTGSIWSRLVTRDHESCLLS